MVRITNLIAKLLMHPAATMARAVGALTHEQRKTEQDVKQLKEKSMIIEREDMMENISREVIENLLNKTVGEVRAYLAFEEADTYLRDVLLEEADFDEEIGCNCDEDDYEDDICDDEDCWDDEEEDEEEYEGGVCHPLENPEEEALAQTIANDILDGKYTIATIRGLYSTDLVKRVADLI